MQKRGKLLKSEKGFTLLTTIMSMGLISVVFAGVGQMSVISAKLNKKNENAQDVIGLEHALHLIVKNNELCSCNFAGATFPVSSAASTVTDLPNIRAYNTSGGGCAPGVPLISAGGQFGSVPITSIQVLNYLVISPSYYLARVVVTALKAGQPKATEVMLGFNTTTTAGNVTVDSCASPYQQVEFSSGSVNHGEIIPEIPGYNKSQCNVMVAPEAMNFATTFQGDKYLDYGDEGAWEDNRYGGFESHYNPVTWQVACQFGMIWNTGTLTSPTGKPSPTDGRCRYQLVCKK